MRRAPLGKNQGPLHDRDQNTHLLPVQNRDSRPRGSIKSDCGVLGRLLENVSGGWNGGRRPGQIASTRCKGCIACLVPGRCKLNRGALFAGGAVIHKWFVRCL